MNTKYTLICEALDLSMIQSTVISIVEKQLNNHIENIDASLVNEYGATSEDLANILIDIEERCGVFLAQDINEKELITVRFLIDSVLIELKDPSARNRIVKQMAKHIEHISESKHSAEEIAKRKRIMKGAAILGAAAGIGVTGAELMLHPAARRLLMRAAKKPGIGSKLKNIGKQVWKPMAVGVTADMAIDPTIAHLNQRAEDRIADKKEGK